MGGYSIGRHFQDFGVVKFVGEGFVIVKPTKKPLNSKPKVAPKPNRNKKVPPGEEPGPDETSGNEGG
jgi:hypothetical protein